MRVSAELAWSGFTGHCAEFPQWSPGGPNDLIPQVRPDVVAPLSSEPHRNPRWRSHFVTVPVRRSEIGEEHSCPSESSLVLLPQ